MGFEWLVSLVIVLVVFAVLWYIVTLLPLPPPFRLIAQIVFALFALFWFLRLIGVWGGHAWRF